MTVVSHKFPFLCAGYYCPNGTEYSSQYPCDPGTYNPHTQATSDAACHPCPAGEYCLGAGNYNSTGLCSPGWYCVGGAEYSMPNVTSQGGECQAGYYCSEGVCSFQNLPCCTDIGSSFPKSYYKARYHVHKISWLIQSPGFDQLMLLKPLHKNCGVLPCNCLNYVCYRLHQHGPMSRWGVLPVCRAGCSN